MAAIPVEDDRRTAWEFVSDIANLARVEGDAVESMTLDGPFRAGTRGTTKVRGQEPTHWRLVEVTPPERSVSEVELAGAVVRFTWTYEELAGGRTRLTRHIVLDGPGAEAYVPLVEAHLVPNVGMGAERLAEEIERDAAGR